MRQCECAILGIVFLVSANLIACDSGEMPSGNDVRDVEAADTTEMDMNSDARDSDTSQDSAMDLGSDVEDGGEEMPECPTDELPSEATVNYDGTTVDKPNLFESEILEWREAGDDALLYEAPSDGTYEVTISSSADMGIAGPGDTTAYYAPDECPSAGGTETLTNAEYIAAQGLNASLDLESGDQALLIVSCPYWCQSPESEYTLTVEKQ